MRTVALRINVSSSEAVAIREAASRDGRSVSSWARRLMVGAASEEPKRIEFLHLGGKPEP